MTIKTRIEKAERTQEARQPKKKQEIYLCWPTIGAPDRYTLAGKEVTQEEYQAAQARGEVITLNWRTFEDKKR